MNYIKDKVFWITGASSGIGEATALLAAKRGAKLVLSARRVEELERVKVLMGLPESDVLVLPMDVEDLSMFKDLTEKIVKKFGRIDILFNNAGISQRGTVNETSMEVYQKLLSINLIGVIGLTKAVLPIMIAQNSGHIAVTSSISGKLGTPRRSGYSATKHALHGFFDSLRAEVVENNISVSIICPGYINTNISENALLGNGSIHGKKDLNQQNGLSVQICAEKIIDALEKNKNEVYMGGKEVLGVYLKRFFPNLLNKIVINKNHK